MLYLFLAVSCSASMALIFKYSETNEGNRYALTSANYLMAVVLCLALWGIQPQILSDSLSFGSLLSELDVVFWGEGLLSRQGSVSWAALLGIPTGLLLFLGLLFYQLSVHYSGVSLSGAFAKLGILLPMILSLLLWKEYPSLFQWLGISFALLAIGLVSWPKGENANLHWPLLLLFFSSGLAEFSNKLFQKVAVMELKSFFLLVAFGTAFLISLIPHFLKKRSFRKKDLYLGLCVGIPNLLSANFLILALNEYPAVVVFPVFSAGTIVTIYLFGYFWFKERLGFQERLAIVLILPALVLMNV